MIPRFLAVPSGIPVCIARMIGYPVWFSFPDILLDDMLRVFIQLPYFVQLHLFIVFCYLYPKVCFNSTPERTDVTYIASHEVIFVRWVSSRGLEACWQWWLTIVLSICASFKHIKMICSFSPYLSRELSIWELRIHRVPGHANFALSYDNKWG